MERICFEKWSAVIAPECGSNVIGLAYDGQELLRSPEDLAQLRGRPCLYGMPLLLPANRLGDARFCFEGKVYTLPVNEPAFQNHIHGLLKDAPFRVTEKTESGVTTRLENTGEYYPFPFELTIRDSLSEGGFLRRLTVENTGSHPMPYTLGFHTAFSEPAWFRVPLEACCEMDGRYLPTGAVLPLTPQQKVCRDGMHPDGSKLSGVYRSAGSIVRIGQFSMTVSEQFDHWVLFNGNGEEGYLCIEPQCGGVNGLNTGSHRVLQPAAREDFTVSFQLTEA